MSWMKKNVSLWTALLMLGCPLNSLAAKETPETQVNRTVAAPRDTGTVTVPVDTGSSEGERHVTKAAPEETRTVTVREPGPGMGESETTGTVTEALPEETVAVGQQETADTAVATTSAAVETIGEAPEKPVERTVPDAAEGRTEPEDAAEPHEPEEVPEGTVKSEADVRDTRTIAAPEEMTAVTVPESTSGKKGDRTVVTVRDTEKVTVPETTKPRNERKPAGDTVTVSEKTEAGGPSSETEPVSGKWSNSRDTEDSAETGKKTAPAEDKQSAEQPQLPVMTVKSDKLEQPDFSLTMDGYPLHLAGDPNYVFVWGNQWSADYIKRDSLKMIRHSAPTFYEITVEVAYVGEAKAGNKNIASTKLMGFEYSFGEEKRRLLYSPQDLSSWVYIDADNNRGSNAERRAIGEMAYYLLFGKPFYGYLGNYDSNFYTSSGTAGLRGVALAGTEEGNSFYVCPGTLHESSAGFSIFVKIGPDLKELKDYIIEFSLMEGAWYYSFYIQNQPSQWNLLENGTVYNRIWQIANHYRKK